MEIELIEKFQNYLQFEKRYSEHTVTAYISDIKAFDQYLLSTYDLSDLDLVKHTHLRSWMVLMVQNKYVAKSINRKISSIRTFYAFLKKQNLVKTNPTSKIVAMKVPKRLPSFLQEHQASELIDLLYAEMESGDYKAIMDCLIIEIVYTCGLRRSECINLEEANIDGRNIKVMGKGGKERLIPIPEGLAIRVKKYIIEKRNNEIPSNGFLFQNLEGKKLYPKYIYNLVKHYVAKVSSIEKRSPHILRHSFATHLSNSGADLNSIKTLLGHSSLAATQIYTHTSIEKLKDIYKKAHPKSGF